MKTLEFKSNTWHYWLAATVGSYESSDGNFCAYVRSVLFGAFVVLFMGGLVGALMYAIGLEVRAFYTCFFTPVCTFGKDEQAIATGAGVILGVVVFAFLYIWNENRKDQIRWEIESGERKQPEPGFISMAYKSIKEKTCFRVEFK